MASEARKLLALGAASVVFSLLVVEGIVRLIEPREVLREFFEIQDPVLHHKFIPSSHGRQKTVEFDAPYTINALGLRNPEITVAKPTGVKRLLMLGDSFTEGVGVSGDETFTSQLRKKLDQAGLSARWQIINGGVASYSPLLEYLYLKNSGLTLEPDLVILNLDLSDIFDDIQYTQLAQFGPQGEPVAVRPEPAPEAGSWIAAGGVRVKDLLKYNTRTYNFLRRRMVGLIEGSRAKQDFSGDVRGDKYGMLRGDPASLDDQGWSRTYDYLLKIRDVLKTRNIDFWIAVYPYGLQISPKEWDIGRPFWGFEADRVYSGRPQELVETFGRKNGIPVVNMTAEFEEAARTTYPLYYAGDGHWRAAGHQVAAASLFKAVAPYIQDGARPGQDHGQQAPGELVSESAIGTAATP